MISFRHRQKFAVFLAAAALAVLPGTARAHLVTTGLGPVYDGIGHFMLSLDDVLPVLALALLAGLRGPAPGRHALFALPLAWLAGGVAGLLSGHAPAFPVTSFSFLVLGGLVAADLHLPPALVTVITIFLGLMHGFLNGAAFQQAGTDALLQLIGVMVTLFVLVALFAGFVVSLRQAWARIVVRVAGSWIAATGLLLLGWSLHKKA